MHNAFPDVQRLHRKGRAGHSGTTGNSGNAHNGKLAEDIRQPASGHEGEGMLALAAVPLRS